MLLPILLCLMLQSVTPSAPAPADTPLRMAVINADMDRLLRLLDAGHDIEQRDAQNFTALHVAAWKNRTAFAAVLLDRGAVIDARGEDDVTPLMIAIEYANGPMVELLIARGADVKARTRSGMTMLHRLAISQADSPILSKLVDDLIARELAVDEPMSQGLTPLHLAASHGTTSAARELLRAGATVDSRDAMGQTPLHLAAARRLESMIDLLLEHDADPRVRDQFNKQPWELVDFDRDPELRRRLRRAAGE